MKRLSLLRWILLALPWLELIILVLLARRFGWWVGAYLLASATAGILLIRGEFRSLFSRLARQRTEDGLPLLSLLAGARTLFAGLLFLFPGVLTDVMAVLLLLVPLPRNPESPEHPDVIEGEWRREE